MVSQESNATHEHYLQTVLTTIKPSGSPAAGVVQVQVEIGLTHELERRVWFQSVNHVNKIWFQSVNHVNKNLVSIG